MVLYSLLTLILSGVQRVLKIKFPIIGDHLEKSLTESQNRISRDEKLFEQSLKMKVNVIWENRGRNQIKFTSEEWDYLIKVFKLDKEQKELRKSLSDDLTFNIQKWSLVEESVITRNEMTEEDRNNLQKQYDDGSLERWFKSEVRNS